MHAVRNVCALGKPCPLLPSLHIHRDPGMDDMGPGESKLGVYDARQTKKRMTQYIRRQMGVSIRSPSSRLRCGPNGYEVVGKIIVSFSSQGQTFHASKEVLKPLFQTNPRFGSNVSLCVCKKICWPFVSLFAFSNLLILHCKTELLNRKKE